MSEKTITRLVVLIAKKGKEQQLKKRLLSLIEPSLHEEGCVDFDLHESLEDPKKFFFYENYQDAEALAIHLEMPHMKDWQKQIEPLLENPASVTTWKIIP